MERGHAIACRAGAAAILTWSNGSVVKIYPDTALTLMGVVFELDKKLEKSLLQLDRGRVFVKAQVPEHIFAHFEIRMGKLFVLTQGAELALKFDEAGPSYTVATLIGRVVTTVGTERVRIDEGNQATIAAASKFNPQAITALPEKGQKALMETSKALGGSLLFEEEPKAGGKLAAKIGGVRNRRGTAPYKVQFKVLVSGGSGKIKKIHWDFGDGSTSDQKTPEYSFTQGVYVVILRVEDENGEKTSAQINISAEEDCNC